MRQLTLAMVLCMVMLSARISWGATFNGHFVGQVVFDPAYPEFYPALLGSPDGLGPDLDGGAVTVRFASSQTAFDYVVPIPQGTDLIVTEITMGPKEPPLVSFGYAAALTNSGHDIPTQPRESALFLGTASITAPPWDTDFGSRLIFYDLVSGPNATFVGVTPEFFVVVDDPAGGDLDIDAVQVVPEPMTLILFSSAAMLTMRRRRQVA